MRLGSNSKIFSGDKNTFKYLAEIGYSCVDFSFAYLYETGVFDLPCEEFWREINKMDREMKAYGLTVYQSHAPYEIPWTGGEKIASATIKSIEAAGKIGSEYIVIHPLMPHHMICESEEQARVSKQVNMDFFRMLLPYAEGYNVKIAIENLYPFGSPASSPEMLKDYIDTLSSPWVTACVDTGHAHIAGYRPEEFLDVLGDKVKTLHLHDNLGSKTGYDEHYVPFLGTLDWDSFMKALKNSGFDGVLNLEHTDFTARFPTHLKLQAESLAFSTVKYLRDKYWRE